MKKGLTWIWLLTKRLYQKPTFLALMLLIPLLVLGYSTVSRQDSGIVTIALSCEDPADPLAQSIIQELIGDTRIIRYLPTETPQEAEALVRSERADGAWIFPEHLQSHLDAYAAGKTSGGFIRIIEGNSSLALTLAREQLGGTVFHHTARAVFLHYLRENAPALDGVSDETLMRSFENTAAAEQLFSFTVLDGTQQPESMSYLTAPLRGMLAVVVVLGALACGIWFSADREKGCFTWVPERRKPLVELGCQLICTFHLSVAVWIALAVAGVAVDALREVVLMLLFAAGTAGFGALLRVLLPGQRPLSSLLPVLLLVMLAACPVFLQLDFLMPVGLLLPPTYFILGAYRAGYLIYFVLYDCAVIGLYLLSRKLLRR